MKYYLPGFSEGPEDAIELNKTFIGTLEWVATKAAEDHHFNHGGWEHTWPLIFVLIKDNGEECGRFSVDRECIPQFQARRLTHVG